MIKNIILVGLGGGLGSIARYLCQRWMLMVLSSFFSVRYFCCQYHWLFPDRAFLGYNLPFICKVMKAGNYF